MGGGLLALAAGRRERLASALAVCGVLLGAVAGVVPAARALLQGESWTVHVETTGTYGAFSLGLDPLSGYFLLAVLGLGAVASIYGREYLRPFAAQRPMGPPWFFYNVAVASMVLILAARNAVTFFGGWEVMATSTYLLISFEHERAAVRRAAWVYLVAAHAAAAFLLGMFSLLGQHAGSLEFAAFARMPSVAPGLSATIVAFAALGFGVKAGVIPLHFWLPEAHAAAPTHVSALMSGVMIKMGLYGFLRILLLLREQAAWWAPCLITVGLAGAIFGISLASYQRDLKRVLAYSSIENVGLIVLALGVGFWGKRLGDERVAVLGFAAALLHLWNHVLMKGLLFLGAGSVVHATGTRDIEHLGGLLRRMPITGALVVLGAVAIAGLPPLNGFVSEWLLYLGLMHRSLAPGGNGALLALLSVGLLALVGGLSSLCFVRLVGVVLLGEPRSNPARQAHEAHASMWVPMAVLACLAVLVAVFPALPVRALSRVIAQLMGSSDGRQLHLLTDAELPRLGLLNLAVWLGGGAIAGLFVWSRWKPQQDSDATWGCGYAAQSPRMQYTGRSFSQLLVDGLFPRVLRARAIDRLPTGFFPRMSRSRAEISDPFMRAVYERFIDWCGNRFARLRWLQQGVLQLYLLYIVVAVVLGLAWASRHGGGL
jgi:formate hydrogenlyase subunit 3/multisubunit Na+/H+ antiporter MnhD subunit